MLNFKEVKTLDLELSTLCNAKCPFCARNFFGYDMNFGYPEHNMSLAAAQNMFQKYFVKQLENIIINGNYGDMIMNPESYEIIEYFARTNPNVNIHISTNGSGRSLEFWRKLGQLSAENSKIDIMFCLDGLEDTHHLYRQNTSWQRIIKNASEYIAAGGWAIWKFILFEHNRHQLEDCKQLSKELGFNEFMVIQQGRDRGPVLDKYGNYTHDIGQKLGEPVLLDKIMSFNKTIDEKIAADKIRVNSKFIEIMQQPVKTSKPNCESKTKKMIYVDATGEVYPCCYLGQYPRTFNQPQHSQLKNMLGSRVINALDIPLSDCMEWFTHIEDSWNEKTYQEGRLYICDSQCNN